MLRRRTIVFFFSDFFDSDYDKAFKRTGRRHDLIAVRLTDPGEEEIPAVGLLELVSIDGIVEEEGEVGKQIEAIIDQIGVGLCEALLPFVRPFTVQAKARGSAIESRTFRNNGRARRRSDP